MRALPTMGVFQPMDAEETRLILEYLVSAWRGPAYLRLTRQNLPDFPLGGAVFQPGKLRCILEKLKSQRVLVLATGSTVEQACLASEILESPFGSLNHTRGAAKKDEPLGHKEQAIGLL